MLAGWRKNKDVKGEAKPDIKADHASDSAWNILTPPLLWLSKRACSHPIHTVVCISILASTSYLSSLENSLLEGLGMKDGIVDLGIGRKSVILEDGRWKEVGHFSVVEVCLSLEESSPEELGDHPHFLREVHSQWLIFCDSPSLRRNLRCFHSHSRAREQ